MPILPDKLNALLDEQDGRATRQAALATPKVSPDDMGRALSIAQRREQPPLVVADNLADFDEREHLDAMEAAGKEPRLGAFLQKPEHAALAKDDLPAMGFLARTITNLFPFVDNPQPRIDRIGEHLKSGFEQAAGGLVQRAVDIAASPFQGLPQASPYAAQTRAGQALGADITDLGQATSAGASAGIRRPASVADALRDPGNTFDYYGGMLAESIPILVAGAGASVGGPGAALAVMGVGTSAQSYGQYRSEGVDPARAGVAADVQGGLEAVFETVPLAAAFKPGAGFVRRFLTTTAAESVSEGATQAAQDQAEATLLGRKITPGQRLANIIDAAIVGVGMAGPLAAVGAAREAGNEDRAARRQQVLDGLNKIDRAATDADNLAALTEAASKTKLGQRSPQAMEQLVGDTGTVYVPVEAVRTLYQGDVAAFAQAITGDPDALSAAGEFGDLAIPLAKWAALVAQQPNAAEWAKHGRTQVDGYSAADMEQAGFLEQTLATDEAAARALPADPAAVDRIRDDVLGMLVASDRYRPEDADRQAGLVARMFATLAQRTGQDAWALYEGYNLRINGRGGQPGKPLQLDPRNEALLDAVLTGRMPSDTEVNGPSLLSSLVAAGGVQDQGGKLTGRDAMKARPGLVNRNGLPLDTAREAMVEAGYLPEGADINALIDAMDAELRGAPVYSQQNRDPARDAFRNDAIDLQRAFDEAFRDMPANEFAKLSRQDIYDRLFSKPGLFQQFAGKVRELYQAAFHGTPHTVDKFSLQRIGTGEGAQAYGWGLYFASSKEIATHYRHELSARKASAAGDQVAVLVNVALKAANGDRAKAVEIARSRDDGSARDTEVIRRLEAGEKGGNLYQVEVPDDSDLLDYNKPLSEQPTKVRVAIEADEEIMSVLRQDAAPSLRRPGDPQPNPMTVLGEGIYNRLSRKFGSPRKFSEHLNSIGIPGLRYLDGNSRNKGEGSYNYVIWDENAIRDVRTLYQGGTNPRGQLRIGANRSMSIDLLAGADLSTFLHETGHFFLEIMGDLAQRPDAPQQVRDDYAAILAWAGNTGEPLTTEQHEAWAEAFEAYLMEGKAPAAELQSAFSRFRAWLTSIYKAMLQLRVPLTDEVRSVMDRMLASDEEIAAAQGRDAVPLPLPDESRALLRPGQWETYVASLEAAGEEARAEVFASLVKAHKRAAEAWYREETARVREQVQAEFEAAPVVRAWRILAGRTEVDGAEVPPELRIKLDRAAIEAMYDAPTAKRMLERLRPLGVYRKTGGVSPDVAASLLGFDSGDALLQGLAEVRNLTARVEAETTARMRERHPDPLTDGSLPEKAMDAVHGAKRVAAIENELGLLAQLANQPRPNRRALAALAERVVAGKRIRDIRPHDYLAGERKAANLAAKAAAQGDYAEALKAKRDQALQAALYSQARKAQEAADSAQRYLKRFTGTKVRARLGKAGADYLEQIDGLLERFDFRQVSGAAADRRARLADWIERQRADGRDLDLPAKLLDDAFRKPWRELTVEELAGLRDSVKQIAHLADLKNVLLLGNERRDRAAVDAAMAASILAGNAKWPDRTGDETLGDKARRDVLQARAATGAATDIARELDGFADGGAVWDNTVRVIRDAITQQVNPALHSAQEALATLYRQHYTMAELRGLQQRRKVPGVPDAWSKGRILSLALNWGNAGNREAILSQARGRLTPEQVGGLLGTLDKRDWDFVQGVWQQIDAYWPAIAEAQRRRKGLAPEKVEPAPFAITTRDGHTLQIPGGYYPLKGEIDTAKAMREEADNFYDDVRTGRFVTAQTKAGFAIARVGFGGRTVRLDLGVVETHLRDVIRDLHLGDAVNYVHQALHGPAFNAAVGDTGTVELVRAMETWLRDVASGEIGLRTRAEKVLRAVRVNFTAAVLTWKFVSAALQITGIVQTSVVLDKKHTLDGVQRYARRPVAMGRYINEASPFMAQRVFSHVEAVQQVMDAKGSRYVAGRSAMIRWGYWMMGRVQRLVDAATWLGAEARGMELFDGDVAKARAYADDVVARAQGSGEFVDKNPLQRGTIGDTVRQSEYIRATTALMGYMIAKSNAAYARTKGTNFRSVREGVKWAGDMANLFVVEALIVAIIRGQMPGDDDEDGSTVDDWLAMAAKEGAANLFGGIPGISQAVSELRGYDAKGIVSSAWESVGKAIEQAKQGELDKAAVKSGVTLAGFATGLPSSQINKTIDAIAAKQDGQDINAYDYIAGPPKD